MQTNLEARGARAAPWRWVTLLAALGSLAAAGDRSADHWVDLDARRQRVLAMSPDRFEHVLHNRDRLAEMSAEEQAKLRRLADEFEHAPDAEQLRHIMLRYHEWLRKLNLPQRSELLELPPEQRLAKIKLIRAEQHARIQAETADGEPLSPADLGHILTWIENHALKHQDKLLADFPPERRRQIEQMEPNKRRRAILFLLVQRNHNGKANANALPPPTLSEINALIEKLSPAAKDSIHQAGAMMQQWKILRQWSQTAVRHRLEESGLVRPMPALAAEELQHFFESGLTPQKREELLNLPPDKMQRELRRLFFQQPNHAGPVSQPTEPAANPHVEDANAKKPPAPGDVKPSKARRSTDRSRNRIKDAVPKDAAGPEAKDAKAQDGD